MSNRNCFVLALAGALLVTSLMSESARAQKPRPPLLCEQGAEDCLPLSASQTTGVKWNPGHYVKTQGAHCNANQDSYYSGIQNNLTNHVESSAAFQGALVIYGWGALELDDGVYDWSRVQSNIDWLSARGKKLLVSIEPRCLQGITDPEWAVPANLEGNTSPLRAGVTADVWDPIVMNQFITFMQAFAAEFDGNPALEQVAIPADSCRNFGGNTPAGYDVADHVAQYQAMLNAAASAFTETTFTVGSNCDWNGEFAAVIETAYQNGQGRADTDAHETRGHMLMIGSGSAVRDYRETIPNRIIVSAPNLGGKDDRLPLSRIQTLNRAQRATHIAWVVSGSTPGGTKADIIQHIEAVGNDAFATCPSRVISEFGGCNR